MRTLYDLLDELSKEEIVRLLDIKILRAWIQRAKSYCLTFKNNREIINPIISKPSNGRRILLSRCAALMAKT